MPVDVQVLVLRQHLTKLQRRYAARGGSERALLDEGASAYLVMTGAIAIMGFELLVNLRTGGDWSFAAHLITVGALELFLVGYFAYALYRKFGIRLRILAVKRRLVRLYRGLHRRPVL